MNATIGRPETPCPEAVSGRAGERFKASVRTDLLWPQAIDGTVAAKRARSTAPGRLTLMGVGSR